MIIVLGSFAMKVLLLIFFGCIWALYGSISDPTLEEIKRAYEVTPLSSWGQQARQQNSLRILCIGGSNTATWASGRGYVYKLDDYLKSKLSDNKYFKSNSYTLNQGRSGSRIDYFTGKKFIFEFTLETSKWPNVVIVDASVNFSGHFHESTFELFVRSIAYKYKLQNLPCPDFLFFNMIHLKEMFLYKPAPATSEERRKYAVNFVQKGIYNGNAETDAIIRSFATHYHMPVISWGNATYPAAIRHYINASFDVIPWEYSNDGVHMSEYAGTTFGVDKLLGPFFKEVMTPRKEAPFQDFNNVPRWGKPQYINMEIVSYTTLGKQYSTSIFKLNELVNKTKTNNWKEYPASHLHSCFGSMSTKDVGILNINIPKECKQVDCHLHVGFIHSWNDSYIGNANCSLYKLNTMEPHTLVSKIEILGQKDSAEATIPIMTEFPTKALTVGPHAIECINLIENKLSCMMEVLITSKVTV